MRQLVLINSFVCVLGVLGGVLFAGASIISIAGMKVPWVTGLLIGAALVPVAFLVSGIGGWVALGRGSDTAVKSLVALPWAYGAAFIVAMLLSFKQ